MYVHYTKNYYISNKYNKNYSAFLEKKYNHILDIHSSMVWLANIGSSFYLYDATIFSSYFHITLDGEDIGSSMI